VDYATQAAAGVLALTFPDVCRLCDTRLTGFPLVPVCSSCLAPPLPLTAEAFCIQCYAPFHSESSLDPSGRCRLCRSGLTQFDALYCVGGYSGRLRDLILLFKYEQMRPLAKPLGDFLRRGYPREAQFDMLVPMPLHWRRQRERGFNQAELLAEQLAPLSGLPVVTAVRRVKHTPRQAGLTGKQRRANVKGAFTVPKPALVRGKRVLLVDDVLTTGASANSCAQALKEAGASTVAILALARADRRFGAGPEAAQALLQFV
jgi:ComF family protein